MDWWSEEATSYVVLPILMGTPQVTLVCFTFNQQSADVTPIYYGAHGRGCLCISMQQVVEETGGFMPLWMCLEDGSVSPANAFCLVQIIFYSY